MNNKLFAMTLLAGIIGTAQAQDANKVYLVKGNKIVGTYPRTNVDYITFNKPADAQQASFTISSENSSEYTIDCPKTAEAGQKVIFAINMQKPTLRPTEVKAGDIECKLVAVNEESYYYTFTMPEDNVGISLATEIDMHIISLKQGLHTTLVMLNSSDEWDKPDDERKYDNFMGKPVKFYWYPDLGFDGELKITTKSGMDVEFEFVTDDEDFGKCWKCIMPDEPITIQTSATEKTDYVGKAFTGKYKGYPLAIGTNNSAESSTPSFNLELNANTSFKAAKEGEKEFAGCYSFDEENNSFKYIEEFSADYWGKKSYGVRGKWFEGGDAWIAVNDLNDDKPDNERYFFVSTSDFNFAVAANDEFSSRNLIEVKHADKTLYYYYSKIDNSIEAVTLNFTKGNSISGEADALVYNADGTPLFRYTRENSTSAPSFVMKGSEAGTYTAEDGKGESLTLDGFNNATYGEESGSYTIEDGVVTFTNTTGDKTTFVIDKTNKTYTTSAASVWDGGEKFAAMVQGNYDTNTFSMGMLAIQLNHEYSGEEKEGAVKVQMTLMTDMYETKEVISNTASYTYDATANQLNISGLLVGTANGRGTERINITFDVNADKTQLTCNQDVVLRAVSGGDTRYASLKGVTLQCKD